MAIELHDIPEAARTLFNATFQRSLLTPPTRVPDAFDASGLFEVIPDTTERVTHIWHGFPGGYSRWKDRRPRSGVRPYSWTVENEPWTTDVIEIDLRVLANDRFGLYTADFEMLAVYTQLFPEARAIELLKSGFTTPCYDEQFFFSASHEEGDSGVLSNILPGTFTRANLIDGYKNFRSLKNDRGDFLQIAPTHLTVSESLRIPARETLNSTTVIASGLGATNSYTKDGNSNGLNGLLTLEVDNRLTPGSWFLSCRSLPIKPFVEQHERGGDPKITYMFDPQDEQVFENNTARAAGSLVRGYGLKAWQLMAGYTP